MKKHTLALFFTSFLGFQFCPTAPAADAPKKLLVVSTTVGFRHSSIPNGERVLSELAQKSGAFTVDFVRQPPGHAEVGFPEKLKSGATEEEKKTFADAEAKWNEALKTELQKLSPDSLANYDGVLFLSTTGDLPLPDKQGFLDWIKEGHAFVGIHAATDTFHNWPPYIEMIGGEFLRHGPQVGVECRCVHQTHPATAHLGESWKIQQEEIYLFKNYDKERVKDLLVLDKHPNTGEPGHFPVSWTREFGNGKVFYTSLGHREDIWEPSAKDPKGETKNPPEVAEAFQAHLLGGIKWALGLEK